MPSPEIPGGEFTDKDGNGMKIEKKEEASDPDDPNIPESEKPQSPTP